MKTFIVAFSGHATAVLSAETEEHALLEAREVLPQGWTPEHVDGVRLVAEVMSDGSERPIDGAWVQS